MGRPSRYRASSDEIVEPVVNLTPLIDVVFVILIIFIVIAPLLELDQIALADAGQGTEKACLSADECSKISIQVHANNEIWFNGKKIALEALPQHFKGAKVQYPGSTPQLFQDRRAHFGVYQSIKNSAEASGFDRIDVVLKP